MAVPSVFLSSVVQGFEGVREAAAQAIRGMGMHAIRSEELAADAQSPERALLDEVEDCDIYMLLLGERYGDVGDGETSPTEDEYDEAVRRHKPILVLVKEGELEHRQGDFLEKIRGSWGDGVFSGRFSGPDDVGTAVAAALGRHQSAIVEDAPAAQERVLVLARGEERSGTMSSGVSARIAYVPLRQTTLLDPLTLDEPNLGDELAGDLRSAGVVPQSVGISPQVSGSGIRLEGTSDAHWTTPEAMIYPDGSMVVIGSVAVEGTTGFSLVEPGKLEAFVKQAGRAAQLIWDRIDQRGEVGQVAVTAAIPEAQYKGYGATSGSSMSQSMSLPVTVLGPEPPEIVARGQLADDDLARRIQAAIKRVFADAGALQK